MSLLLWVIIVLVFLLGGVLQLLGVVTVTQLTLVISFLLWSHFLFTLVTNKRLSNGIFYFWGLVATAAIIVSAWINSTPSSYLIGSLLAVLVPLSILQFVAALTKRGRLRDVVRILVFISVLQLPIMLIQKIFYDELSSMASQPIDYIDIAYGTFFLKSDHALAFLMLCLVVFTLLNNASHTVIRWRRPLLILWTGTIALSNSKIAVLLLLLVFSGYLFGRQRQKVLASLLLVLAGGLLVYLGAPHVDMVTGEIYERGLARIESGDAVDRYAPLIVFALEPMSWFGNGPFSYYNPLTKEWGIQGGHSQWYSAYFDFGAVGLMALGSLFLLTAMRARRVTKESYFYMVTIFAFGLVSQPLTDPAMLLIYFSFLAAGRISLIRTPSGQDIAYRLRTAGQYARV